MEFYPQYLPESFEFDQVKSLLEEKCRSILAKEKARALQPSIDLDAIRASLRETAEVQELMDSNQSIPLQEFPDIRKLIRLLKVENAVLMEDQHLDLLAISDASRSVLRFLETNIEHITSLQEKFSDVIWEKEVSVLINNVIDGAGLVKSNASPELASIRRMLNSKRREAGRSFNNLLMEYRDKGWLREFSEGFQNGRRVLAVVSEYKRKIKGVVHGSSSSGSTAFIEPMGTVVVNNEILLLEDEEKKEIYRILQELTKNLRPYDWVFEQQLEMLAEVDFIRGKAHLAVSMNAVSPGIGMKKEIRLKQAYHPLLLLQNKAKKQPTIPMDLHLDEVNRILIISGPNAGGKSVALKTLGLIQLMVQSGLLVPVHPDSATSLFALLLADIGDNQSIEFEVSTYSAKLEKMKRFIELAQPSALCLIDEFGSGSDPELGGALAEVVLEALNKTGAYGIITTHYAVVKVMAEKTDGLINGCMLFDSENMQPLYRLTTGRPGSSYTFEVAQNIGLPPELIKRARKLSDISKVRFDDLLNELQKEKDQAIRKKNEMDQIQKGLKEQLSENELIGEEMEELLENTKAEGQETKKWVDLGRQYQKMLDDWLENRNKKQILTRVAKKADQQEMRKKSLEKKAIVQEKQKKQKAKRAPKPKARSQKIIEVGDEVTLKGSKEKGTVEEIRKSKAHVTFGAFKSIIEISRLEQADN